MGQVSLASMTMKSFLQRLSQGAAEPQNKLVSADPGEKGISEAAQATQIAGLRHKETLWSTQSQPSTPGDGSGVRG